jgi:hypothetical protein
LLGWSTTTRALAAIVILGAINPSLQQESAPGLSDIVRQSIGKA